MKITSIEIQGMHKVQRAKYDLKNLTYLHGNNGVGKSTVLEAIQLALLGYIPGTPKQKQYIFSTHANGPMLSVKLIFSNGQSIQRSWVNTGKDITASVIKDDDIDVESLISNIELPIFNFSEFVSMSANQLKDWFVDNLPTPAQDDSVEFYKEMQTTYESHITKDQTSELYKYIEQGKECGTDINKIRTLVADLKNELSIKNAESKRITASIQELTKYDDVDSTTSVDTIRQQIDDNSKELTRLQAARQARQDYVNIQNQLNEYNLLDVPPTENKEYVKLVDIQKQLNDKMKEIMDRLEKCDQRLVPIVAEIASYKSVLDGKGQCPYTHTTCESVSSLVDTYKNKTETLQQEILTISEEKQKLQKLKSTISEETIQIAHKQQTLLRNYAQLDTLRSMLPKVCPEDLDYEQLIADTVSRNNKCMEDYKKAIANEQYNKLYEMSSIQLFLVQQEILVIKSWIALTDVNGIQSKLMALPFAQMSNTISNYLSDMYGVTDKDKLITATFNLESKANSFSFGITRDGQYIKYEALSGGEKCIYVFALMCSILEVTNTELPIILVDDLLDHLDINCTTNLFKSLYNMKDIQIIIAGVNNTGHKKESEFTIEIQ